VGVHRSKGARQWERMPEQPEQNTHECDGHDREWQPTLAVKPALQNGGVDIDAKPREGDDPNCIFKDGYGKDAHDEPDLLPEAREDKVCCQQTCDKQRERRVDAAAFLCDLYIHTRQRKPEAVSEYGYSQKMEQAVTRVGGTLLQKRDEAAGHNHRNGDHQTEVEQRENGSFKGSDTITENE